MAKSGDVLSVPELGAQIRFLETAAETGGARTQFEVTGRPRGFLVAAWHLPRRPDQRSSRSTARWSSSPAGRTHVLQPRRHPRFRRAPPTSSARLRARATGRSASRSPPPGRTEAFLERLAAFSRDGRLLRGAGRARPPRPSSPRLRRRGARRRSRRGRSSARRRARSSPAPAPPGRSAPAPPRRAATSTCSSTSGMSPRRRTRSSPPLPTRAPTRRCGRPVYIDVEAEGPPALGKESRQHFKGRLPYHLHTRSRITRLEPPHVARGRRRRRPSRPRDLDADAPRRPAPTCASTGASTPTARCCAR